jgi:hypothetical protein
VHPSRRSSLDRIRLTRVLMVDSSTTSVPAISVLDSPRAMANFPRRRTAAGPFRPDFRAVIETDDGTTIMSPN